MWATPAFAGGQSTAAVETAKLTDAELDQVAAGDPLILVKIPTNVTAAVSVHIEPITVSVPIESERELGRFRSVACECARAFSAVLGGPDRVHVRRGRVHGYAAMHTVIHALLSATFNTLCPARRSKCPK